jgi:hypothetical protein
MKTYSFALDPPLAVARAVFSAIVLFLGALFARIVAPDYWRTLITSESVWLSALTALWLLINLLAYVFDLRERAQRMPEAEPEIIPRLYQSVAAPKDDDRPYQYLFELRAFEMVGISETQLRILAQRVMREGAHMVYTDFTPHWKGFTRGQFKKLQAMFVERKYARWEVPNEPRASVNLFPNGARFLNDVLSHSPTEETHEK